MDIEQLQDAFRSLTSVDQRLFLKSHLGELRDAIGISRQMLVKDVETEEIVSELLYDRNMTISELLDNFCDIDSVRDIIQEYQEYEFDNP
jgi:hypothetical protein